MKEATSIIIHSENNTAVKCLTNEQAGILFKGILEYSSSGMPLESTYTALQALFSMFKVQIDRDFKKYSDRCEQNRLNALRRHQNGNNRPQSNTNESDGMPLQANACKSNNNSNDKCKNKNNDDIANASNINIESNPLEIQSNGINNNPRIDKQEKRKRDVLSAATNVIAGFSSTSK